MKPGNKLSAALRRARIRRANAVTERSRKRTLPKAPHLRLIVLNKAIAGAEARPASGGSLALQSDLSQFDRRI